MALIELTQSDTRGLRVRLSTEMMESIQQLKYNRGCLISMVSGEKIEVTEDYDTIGRKIERAEAKRK